LAWDEDREHEHCNIEVYFNPGTPQRYKECKWSLVVDTLKAGAILASLGIVTGIRFAYSRAISIFWACEGFTGKSYSRPHPHVGLAAGRIPKDHQGPALAKREVVL
jgi:hypothetical protein